MKEKTGAFFRKIKEKTKLFVARFKRKENRAASNDRARRRKIRLKRALKVTLFSLLTVFLIALITITIILISFYYYVNHYIDPEMDSFFLMAGSQNLTSYVYYEDSDGTLRFSHDGVLHGAENRTWADYDEIPQALIDAMISVEDKRFFEHSGVDWLRSARAAFYFMLGRPDSGGSTITQQTIKNVTREDATTIQRKIKEILRAEALEKNLDKTQILELYLNTIYFSEGAYGVRAAARTYFSKELDELTLIECAAIAAISQSPAKWDPILHPENNKLRRDLILSLMLDQGKIDRSEYQEAADGELTVHKGNVEKVVTSWYTDAAISEAIGMLASRLKISRSEAALRLYNGGYTVVTAMNPTVQSVLEEYYKNELNFIGAGVGVQSSAIIIDPQTGYVLGLVGGVGEKVSSRLLGRATDTRRSPGSAIKPLSVFAPAMEAGLINWATVFDDVPKVFEPKGASYTAWPSNASGVYAGLTPVHSALANSINTVAVDILRQVGNRVSYDFLQTLGISSLTQVDLNPSSLALGGMDKGVSLIELTAAYGIFATGGYYNAAKIILEIRDNGGEVIVDKRDKNPTRILSAENADILVRMMEEVLTGGTAKNVNMGQIPAAGKTGTTSNNSDKWFVGYTPYLLGGVWVGYDTPSPVNSPSGNNPASVVWERIMKGLHSRAEVVTVDGRDFPRSDKVVTAAYCRDSGHIAADVCLLDPRGERVEIGYFTAATLPVEYCAVHVAVDYCTGGHEHAPSDGAVMTGGQGSIGGVASEYCPPSDRVCVAMLAVRRDFPIQVYVTDAQFVYIPPEFGLVFTEDPNKPFFINQIETGRYVGISRGAAQYNRYCIAHYNNLPYGYYDYFKQQQQGAAPPKRALF